MSSQAGWAAFAALILVLCGLLASAAPAQAVGITDITFSGPGTDKLYTSGETLDITVTYSGTVTVTVVSDAKGDDYAPIFRIDWASPAGSGAFGGPFCDESKAVYHSGSGTSSLVFRCTITNGPWTRVAVAANSLSWRLSAINGSDSRHGAFERTTNLHGQPLGATITRISVSSPGSDDLWRKGGTLSNTVGGSNTVTPSFPGDTVELTYTFSEPVNVTTTGGEGTPTVRARLGKVTYEFPYNRVENGGRNVVFRMEWKWGNPATADVVPYNWRTDSVTVPANALSLHRQLDGYFGYDDVGVIASTATGRLANIRHAGLATGFLCFRTPAVHDAIVSRHRGRRSLRERDGRPSSGDHGTAQIPVKFLADVGAAGGGFRRSHGSDQC